MRKVIVHIDLNAFFARAEEIKDPTLENKPLAIGHEGRGGIVSTCSYEARKYGVHSGMPMFQAKKLCPHLIIKECDFRYYSKLSREFMSFVKRYTPIIEVASIDECYADFTNVIKGIKDVPAFFKQMQDDLYKETKLKCSMGIACTKFLAKMGSDYKKPMGITIIRNKDIEKIIYPLPIGDMFGIGKKTAPRLIAMGINTIGDLVERLEKEDQNTIAAIGKFALVLNDWAHGLGSDEVITEPDDYKSIGNSSTFSHDTDNYDEIKQMFEDLSHEVSSRAIRENRVGNTIQIVVKDTEFKVHNKSLTFDKPVNDFLTIFSIAMKLYDKNFVGMNIRLAGVTLQNLIDPRDVVIQMSLFDYEKHEEESATKLLINELNRRLKSPILMRASELGKK